MKLITRQGSPALPVSHRFGWDSARPIRGQLQPTLLLAVSVLVLVLSTFAIFGYLPLGEPSWITLQMVLLLCAALAGFRSFLLDQRRAASGKHLCRMGSAILGIGTLIAVVLPGQQLMTGGRISRLTQLGLQTDGAHDVALAYGLWLLAMLAFVLGEEIGCRLEVSRSGAALGGRRRGTSFHTPFTFVILVGFGLMGAVIGSMQGHQEILATRGNVRGEGALVMLEYGFALASVVAILSFRRSWQTMLGLLVSLLGAAYVVWLTGSRSSLMLIGLAAVIRLTLNRSRRFPLKRVLLIAAMAYGALTVLVAVPIWRSAFAQGSGGSFGSVVLSSVGDPLSIVASAGGLDTLDGLILSTKVDPAAVGASWTDPLKAIVNLVPYQIWPNKPEFLGPAVTHAYLNFGGGAGIFLSGPGYALIVFGGPFGMAVAFLILGLISAWIFQRFAVMSLWTVLLSYFLLRFFFGGDSFDALQTIELALTAGVAFWVTRTLAMPLARKEALTGERHLAWTADAANRTT